MSRRVLFVTAWICAIAACASPTPRSAAPGSDAPGSAAPESDAVAQGQALYDTNGCADCHGREGHGDGRLAPGMLPAPRDFRQVAAYKGAPTLDGVAKSIAEGLSAQPAGMPAYSHLDESDRRVLAAYVLSIGGLAREAHAADTPQED